MSSIAQNSPDRPVSNYDESQPTREREEGLTGQIKADDGNPVEGAMIVPKSLEADGPAIPEIAIISDADGRYLWPLPPSTYEVSVIADGYHSATKRVAFGAGEVVTLDFLLHLRR